MGGQGQADGNTGGSETSESSSGRGPAGTWSGLPRGAAAPRPGPHPGQAGARLLSTPCGWLEGKPHQVGIPVGVTHGADIQYIAVEGMSVSRP